MQSHLLSRTKRIDGKKMRESWGGQRESRICLDYCCPLSANTPPQLQACSGPHSSQARGEGEVEIACFMLGGRGHQTCVVSRAY